MNNKRLELASRICDCISDGYDDEELREDAYSITGIPEIIVFAPDGTILHRGLRGQELENAVVEYLQTHP